MAYKSHGSVYMDIAAFKRAGHDYLAYFVFLYPKILILYSRVYSLGMAYESHGSVYMDIAAFKRAGHDYPKLQPAKGRATEAEMEESEGSHKAMAGEKQSKGDFSLWKASI